MTYNDASIKELISRRFDELFPDSTTYQSFNLDASGLDSLEFMEIIMELEDMIGVPIPESLIENTNQTIGELIEEISKLANAK
jgi:acyl carrier protein